MQFLSKLADGSLTELTISAAFSGFSVSLEDVFSSVLSLAQSAVTAVKPTGASFYLNLLLINTAIQLVHHQY